MNSKSANFSSSRHEHNFRVIVGINHASYFLSRFTNYSFAMLSLSVLTRRIVPVLDEAVCDRMRHAAVYWRCGIKVQINSFSTIIQINQILILTTIEILLFGYNRVIVDFVLQLIQYHTRVNHFIYFKFLNAKITTKKKLL